MPDLNRTSRRLILRSHVESGDIRALAENNQWEFIGEIDRDPEKGIFYPGVSMSWWRKWIPHPSQLI
ncbi:hypothetical protein ACFWNT_33960 [Streptomyces sp. NPDC058409]|uniref:hypothetical protein n=1 Tax=Streptomyces sp. NPDC058409 TaxID=3346484 RepID=UPI00365F0571